MEKDIRVTIKLKSNSSDSQSFNELSSRFETLEFSGKPVNVHSGFNLTSAELVHFKNNNQVLLGYISYLTGYKWLMKKESSKKLPVNLPEYFLFSVNRDEIRINQEIKTSAKDEIPAAIKLSTPVSKEKYIEKLNSIRNHLQHGDIYEATYCIPFTAENIELDAEIIWERLNKISPMPFSALLDTEEFSVISASPERFTRKTGKKVFLQPMKGTSKKGTTEKENEQLMRELKNDPKERSENVMIVDLSRNDLSAIAEPGTVHVNELYGVYEFPNILQMISTISCEVVNKTPGEILKATFPMGSMTGAPKHRAMQIIDEQEDFSRGPFSGMLGYIDENNDFDFSVLIRTIFYDKNQKKIFLAVGSAITIGSDPEKEYEECLIKLQPLLKALNATID